ncbi:hypothetical protein XA68_10384 [Ophiocordyceps unilateralis]|uniref:DUF6923 domain-containing protein n=1 Tax=Ophiocordyceps unilateralis TaxID=268505 RepID=A0A2A9PIQ4_OPHUN|nr:hypothetical protein XA68_10384 [Ophiocordyceps unilateralis]
MVPPSYVTVLQPRTTKPSLLDDSMLPVALAVLWAAATTNAAHRVCPLGGDSCATTVAPVCPALETPERLMKAPPPRSLPCSYESYVIQDNSLYRMDLRSGHREILSANVRGNIAALVYNHLDSMLYGVNHDKIMRIYPNGATELVTDLGVLKKGFNRGRDKFVPKMGAIDKWGQYWLSVYSGGEYIVVDLNPRSRSFGTVRAQGASRLPRNIGRWRLPAGWAWTVGDMHSLYGIGYDYLTGRTALFRWKIQTSAWEVVGHAKSRADGDTFSAVVATSDGIVYGLEDSTGDIFRFNISAPNHMDLLQRAGPISQSTPKSNTAARCVLLEDGLR